MDDDYLSQDEKVVHTNPTFISDSTNQLVNEGETIKLPCLVDKLGKFMWFFVYKTHSGIFMTVAKLETTFFDTLVNTYATKLTPEKSTEIHKN